MKIRVVASAGRLFNNSPSMGTLLDEGILTKEYVSAYPHEGPDIIWTNVSEDTMVVNDHETIRPGQSVTWEK